MLKTSWNTFTKNNKNPIGFKVVISESIRKGNEFDKNNKKLPNPYDLFSDWCSNYLSEEWSIKEKPGSFLICVSSQSDADLIIKEFGVHGTPKITAECKNTTQFDYKYSEYALMAGDLGYVL